MTVCLYNHIRQGPPNGPGAVYNKWAGKRENKHIM